MADKTVTSVDVLAVALDERYVLAGNTATPQQDARWLLGQLEAAGFRIVPLEPTEAMCEAACDEHAGAASDLNEYTVDKVLAVALAAAPTWGDKP